jgi:signal transduction histidine kinase
VSTNVISSSNSTLAPAAHGRVSRDRHEVQLYADDAFLVNDVSCYLGAALAEGDAAIVVATEEHRSGIARTLRVRGFDVAALTAQGRFLALDAEDTLSQFTTAGSIDPAIFADFLGNIILGARAAATSTHPRVFIFGEMVALLFAAGKAEAAVHLEQLWNRLAHTHSFCLRCAYPIHAFGQEQHGPHFADVCGQHSHVIPDESYSALTSDSERLLTIARLQQKAQTLQAVAEERERLATALAVEVNDLRRLHDVSTRVAQLDLHHVMQDILAAVTALHNTGKGILSLRDPARNTLRVGASTGFSQDFLASVDNLPAGSGACGASMQRRERVIVEDVELDPLFATFTDAARHEGFRAVHSTPLLDRSGDVIGVLSVHFRAPYKPSDREVRLTDLYARLAVSAIENARLYQEAQQEIARRTQAEEALKERIVELNRAHLALLEAEKSAATGRLAAAIAHEINNPLEAITNLVYLLKSHKSLSGEAHTYTALCERELQRVGHIVKQTLGFYRNSGQPVSVSVSDVVCDALALHERRLRSRDIEVTRELADCNIVAYPGEVRQVLLNIVGNAIQASREGGKLRLRVRAAVDWKNLTTPGVRITVADNGTGIQPQHKHKISSPFFSTKAEKGTGLGLWVSKGIVQKHLGSIRFRSRSGQGSGTCFTVFLPANSSATDNPAAWHASPAA